jgi:hypothetical protein
MTVADLITNLRIKLRDRDTDNPINTDAEIMLIFDRVSQWLLGLSAQYKADLGTLRVTFTGDGSTEYDLPDDFWQEHYFYFDDGNFRPPLRQTNRAEYDRGWIANQVQTPGYYVLDGRKVLFISDLGTGQVITLDYYAKPDPLETTDLPPFEGIFDNLYLYWAEVELLDADEFSTTTTEKLLVQEQKRARQEMTKRGHWANKEAKLRSRRYMNTRGRNRLGTRHSYGGGDCNCTGRCGCGG